MADDVKGMVSLVNYLGDARIKFQVVHNSIDGQVVSVKGGTRFTMITDPGNLQPIDLMAGKPRKYGLLLWIDAEPFDAWLKGEGS